MEIALNCPMTPPEFPLRLPILILFMASGLGQSLTADTELNIPGYRIEWHDEFEEAVVDTSKWDVNVGVNAWYELPDGQFVEPHWFNEDISAAVNAGTINGERQYYTPDNVSVNEGILVIQAEEETVTDPVGLYDPAFHTYTSGKLNTADEFQFTFGIVKFRAKLPAGQGLWPALWMLNAPDPWFWDDEVDVMEARGAQPTITTSAHHYKVTDENGNRQNFYNSNARDTGINLQEGFHEYGLEWTSESIQTWMDDQAVFYDDIAIPQGPMFLIMNAAVGGGFGGDPDDTTVFPTTFEIDWVRVWQPATTPSDLASGGFEQSQGAQWANWNTRGDGNLSTVMTGALHGEQSVQISRRNEPVSVVEEEPQPQPDTLPTTNLLTDGTAGPWRGYLNEGPEAGTVTNGYEIDPASIPAITEEDSVTISVHQSAPLPWATAVAFRQFDGSSVQGKTLTFTGTVAIEEAFAEGSSAKAFIRVFNSSYNTTDFDAAISAGGEFTIETTIPEFGVPIVHAGIETTGSTGSAGRLAATALTVMEESAPPPPPPPPPVDRTGFYQTVIAEPGQPILFGLLAANHPEDPMGASASGMLRLEFLDEDENVISVSPVAIVEADTPAHAVPYLLGGQTPENAAFVRLDIDREVLDPENDLSGSFIVDAAFIQVLGMTELPVVTSGPASGTAANAGQTVDLKLEVTSPTDVTYQWYHDGNPVSTDKDLSFVVTPDSAGTWFVVASNAAGPVVGAVTELTVLEPLPDSDGDGISDDDETNLHGTDPNLADSDKDGINDYGEIFVSLTNPRDADSVLKITKMEMPDGKIELTFQSVSGVVYQAYGSPDILQWSPLGTTVTASDDTSTILLDLPVSDPPLRFFRIEANGPSGQ
jgi:beta-glucanase (GH16 family)